jgi:hypothetical protein
LLRRARGTHSSSSTRIGDQVGLRLFKRSNNDFSTDGGKVVKKSLQRMTAFDVVDERLHNGRRALTFLGSFVFAFAVFDLLRQSTPHRSHFQKSVPHFGIIRRSGQPYAFGCILAANTCW